ncbi:MAG: Type 1 glutamine amidotransferase-like domain-containing protein [Pseudomonadota bacterium]
MFGGYYIIGGVHRPNDLKGGGLEAAKRLYAIFTEVTALTGQEAPKVIYIDAATNNKHAFTAPFRDNLQQIYPQGQYTSDDGSSSKYFFQLDLSAEQREQAQVEVIDKAFAEADIVYMNGGPEFDNLKAVIETYGLKQRFEDFVARGGLVGGQSAGGIILAEQVADGDAGRTVEGIGALPGVAVAAHIDRADEVKMRIGMVEDAAKEIDTITKRWGVASGHAIVKMVGDDKPLLLSPKGQEHEADAFFVNGMYRNAPAPRSS